MKTALFGNIPIKKESDLFSPELTTGGSYPKAWYKTSDGIYLLKRGSETYEQREIMAEVYSSNIINKIFINGSL